MRIQYHTGRSWTAPHDEQSMLEALGNNRNNARLPAFFQLDLRIERNWRYPNWQFDLFLDIANSTYSREIFQCTAGQDLVGGADPRGGLVSKAALVTAVDPNKGIVAVRAGVSVLTFDARFEMMRRVSVRRLLG